MGTLIMKPIPLRRRVAVHPDPFEVARDKLPPGHAYEAHRQDLFLQNKRDFVLAELRQRQVDVGALVRHFDIPREFKNTSEVTRQKWVERLLCEADYDEKKVLATISAMQREMLTATTGTPAEQQFLNEVASVSRMIISELKNTTDEQ